VDVHLYFTYFRFGKVEREKLVKKIAKNVRLQYNCINNVAGQQMPNSWVCESPTNCPIRRFTMFNFKETVDQVAKASKQPLTYVEDKAIRTSIETLVDTYADFTKTMYDTSIELSKQMVESTKSTDFSKSFEKIAKSFKVAA